MLESFVMILVIAVALSIAGAVISLLIVGIASMSGSKTVANKAKRVAKVLFIIFAILFVIALIVHFIPAFFTETS